MTAHVESVGTRRCRQNSFVGPSAMARALATASAHLSAAAEEQATWELFAEELRLAHNALGTITGEFTSDDLLGEIFSRFCIGK